MRVLIFSFIELIKDVKQNIILIVQALLHHQQATQYHPV